MRYKYQAIDAQGQAVSGILNTDTEREAARQLQRRGLTTLSLTPLTAKTASDAPTSKPKRRDILIVLHELTTLLESGVSLIEAVESLAQSSHHPFITQTFAEIAKQLRQGIAFSTALQTSALALPWYIIHLLEAGELTGKVANALRDGVEQMEYEARINDEMRNALIYPVILIVSGISAVLIIFMVVVPRFANMLQNRTGDIPWLAQFVLSTGMFLHDNYWIVIIGISMLVVVSGYTFSQPTWRAKVRDVVADFPLVGHWLLETETARWAAMLSTLLENKVSLLRALELASRGVTLLSLQARLRQVTKAVRGGTSLSQALQDNDALSPTGHNLIRAGERAGELAKMLRSLAKLLEESGRVRTKRLLLLIEPAAILIIGAMIGIIITGIILAITSVNEINF
jgi:general secretion pathway protein F